MYLYYQKGRRIRGAGVRHQSVIMNIQGYVSFRIYEDLGEGEKRDTDCNIFHEFYSECLTVMHLSLFAKGINVYLHHCLFCISLSFISDCEKFLIRKEGGWRLCLCLPVPQGGVDLLRGGGHGLILFQCIHRQIRKNTDSKYALFYARGLKSPLGASSNRIVRLFACPFVHLSVCPLFHPAYIKSAIIKVLVVIH